MCSSPLAQAIAEYDLHFAARWRGTFDSFTREADDRLWLAGPSSYLFSLAGVKFAVDPQIRRKKDFDQVKATLAADCGAISFVLITHPHDDHMCLPLMRALRDTPIRWYIPADISDELLAGAELHPETVIRVRAGDGWQEGPLTFRAFHSPHARPGHKYFPQCGYLIDSPAARILLPSDVRDYSYRDYPDFGEVDLCLAHVWAGDDALTETNYLPMMDQFARFQAQFTAKRYFLCHLYEIGRTEKFMWHDGHAAIAAEKLRVLLPQSAVEVPRLWGDYAI